MATTTTRTGTASTDYPVHKYVYAIYAGETASGAATITLKNGGASGTAMFFMNVQADDNAGLTLDEPMYFPDGVYVTVTGGLRYTLIAE